MFVELFVFDPTGLQVYCGSMDGGGCISVNKTCDFINDCGIKTEERYKDELGC